MKRKRSLRGVFDGEVFFLNKVYEVVSSGSTSWIKCCPFFSMMQVSMP